MTPLRPLLLACQATESASADPLVFEAQAHCLDLSLSPLEAMPTVLEVRWSGELTGDVLYHDGEALRRTTPTQEVDEWVAHLVGARPGAQVSAWVEGDHDGQAFGSETVSVEAGELLDAGPEREIRDRGTDTSGLVLVAYGQGEEEGVMLLDRAGETVWHWQAGYSGHVASALWTPEGPWVLIEEKTEDPFAHRLVQLGLDGEPRRTIVAAYAHHDFALEPDDSVVWLQAAPMEVGGVGTVYGDRLVRTDAEGHSEVLWDAWQTLDVEEGGLWDRSYYADGRDWTHANGLHAGPDDTWLVSLGGLAQVLEIDGLSGDVLRRFDGLSPDLGDEGFSFQHGPTWTDDGRLLLFVNQDADGDGSWAAEYTVDGDELTPVWRSDRSEDLLAQAMGHAWRLDDGGTVVDYGQQGVVEELDADGRPRWVVALEGDTWISQGRLVEDYELD